MRLVAIAALVAIACAVGIAQEKSAEPALNLTPSELDIAQREIVSLNEQLRVARAQRADCETTLGPIEAAMRGQENQRALDALKTAIEARHPGAVYDVKTGTLSVKAPELKKDR